MNIKRNSVPLYYAASRQYVDVVIRPRETRPQLIRALELLRNKCEPGFCGNTGIFLSKNAQRMKDKHELSLLRVKELLRQFGIKAKKRLGQHFLLDETVLRQIILAADLSPEDIVIEVGPGLGILTRELAKKAAKVIAVELDAQLVAVLKKTMASFPNVFIVNADILQLTPSQLVPGSYKVVANLPYYITSPVLRHFLEASLKPELMVVMVQREVGEAIVASSGKMSLLSLSVQFYAKPSIVTYVPAQSFYPSPKVDSVILRFDLLPQPAIIVDDIPAFFDVVRRGFSSPRKQLRNSLAQGLGISASQVASILESAGIEPQRRAEMLTLGEWAKIWQKVGLFEKG